MTPKITTPKPTLDTSKKPSEGIKPLKVRATVGESELKVPSVGRSRGASCPRCPPREPGHRVSAIVGSRDRTRSSSTAPKLTAHCTKAFPQYKEPKCPAKQATVQAKCCQQGAHGQTQQHRHKSTNNSHKAFTVIPPDPKKRLETQRKAEAELSALEELRLSKAMTYVSISPRAVGGCLSLEEVRLKQQQEMMQAKRKPRQIKEPVMVLTR